MDPSSEDGARSQAVERSERDERERGVVAAALALLGVALLLLSWPCGSGGPPPAELGRVQGAARLLLGEPLDLNRAAADSLEALPGIGPGRAAAIVKERGRRPFASVHDLQRVRGIGPRTVARLEGLVCAR